MSAVRGPKAASSSSAVATSTTFTPTERTAASYTLRECFGMMHSSFGKPRRSGTRTWRSGFPPVTQAAVAWVSAAEQPVVTIPHSAWVSSERRLPIASASSSRWT